MENLNNEKIVEICMKTVAQVVVAEVRRRRVAAVLAVLRKYKFNSNSKYKKKKFLIAPILQGRLEHGFYHASIPKLQLEDLRYRNCFRMSATQMEELLNIVGHRVQKQDVIRESISSSQRLAVTLRYLASGDSMTYLYLLGKTTVSNIINETCSAIWDCLHPLVLPPSLSEDEWKNVAQEFEELRDFIHCIGAIDGKHVVIQCPNNAGSTYYNYKNAHSIVLMAICDANYIFRFVDIGAFGRRSDGGVFQCSTIGQKFDGNLMNVPKPEAVPGGRILPFCLVGDEAFPSKPYLLRPYPGKHGLTSQESIYNYRLSRSRRMIENTFGILASQWRIYWRPIIAKPKHVVAMIQSTICLHNWLRKHKEDNSNYVPQGLVDEDHSNNPDGFRPGSWRRIMEDGCAFTEITKCGSNMYSHNSRAIRDEFRDYFCNEGAVPWQESR